MKTRIFGLLIAFLMVFSLVPMAFATETEETTEATAEATESVRKDNECGEGLTWSYDDGVLTIEGSGTMDDFAGGAPWKKYKDEAKKVVMDGVVYIGSRAFYDFDKLETVEFGSGLIEIGYEAFRSCEALEKIELPASFKVFGEGSFLGCTALKEIHCEGHFPSFRMNSMWECYATIYYPAERPWPLEHIEQLEEAFHGRLEFLASDGTDHYVPTEATESAENTEAPTQKVTEPATEAPTDVPTEMPTEAPTETTVPPTEAVTEAPAEPETEPPTEAYTEPATEETVPQITEEEQKAGNRVALLGMGIALALTMIVALLLVIRQATRKGKYTK